MKRTIAVILLAIAMCGVSFAGDECRTIHVNSKMVGALCGTGYNYDLNPDLMHGLRAAWLEEDMFDKMAETDYWKAMAKAEGKIDEDGYSSDDILGFIGDVYSAIKRGDETFQTTKCLDGLEK